MSGGDQRMLLERVALEQQRLQRMDELLARSEVETLVGANVAKALRMLVARQARSYDDLTEAGPGWSSLSRRIETGDRVLAECISVIAGASARAAPLLGAASTEARALASELASETLVAPTHDVIPADTECAGMASSVVRRRFPDHGIWDVPVVAHEFGHLVVRDLLDINPLTGDQSRPLAEFLVGQKVQLAELAADVYATFALGPAYTLTLVLHRMNPYGRAVAAEDASHPGDPSRVHAVLRALELLDASDPREERRTKYDFLVEKLRQWWGSAQESADLGSRLDEVEAARVDKRTDDIWGRLMGSKLVATRYDSYMTARALADALVVADAKRPSADSVRDALNAVWLTRFRAWRDDTDLPEGIVEWAQAELRRLQSGSEGGSHD